MLKAMKNPKKYEEAIGVTLPGKCSHMVKVLVSALDSDEEVLRRISTVVGTIFNVTGTRYKVTSGNPFKLKLLGTPQTSEPEGIPLPKVLPQIGETWKPKDKRRPGTFKIASIEGDYAFTEDRRKIALGRFSRYDRLT